MSNIKHNHNIRVIYLFVVIILSIREIITTHLNEFDNHSYLTSMKHSKGYVLKAQDDELSR